MEKLAPGAQKEYSLEYKFDGLTLNLTYEGGQLVGAATRGNGEVGEEILPQVRTIQSVPLSIPFTGRMEVQGEGIMPLSALKAYNATAEEPLKNARNAAAGALRNLDPRITASRRLIKVMPEDAEATAQVFDLLLGDNLQGRKDHIAENGYKYLELADIS